MPIVRLTQEAVEDFEQSAIWYEHECAGLGQKFVESVESGLTLLEEEFPPLVPVDGEAGRKGAKQIVLHQFPFSLIVLPTKDEMVVIAVAHHSRRPFFWSDRIDT